jgi:hypothetical protein
MYKVTKRGIEDFGGINKLSAEDLETIACIIGHASTAPMVTKIRGAWKQSYFMDDAVEGYRVFEPKLEEGDSDK